MGVNFDDLKAKGFFQNGDGSWSKPGAAVSVRAVETHSPEQIKTRPLDGGKAKLGRSKRGVEICVRLVALRRRLLDSHDNARYACKPLVDAIAETLGIDDADPRVKWEYGQVETRGVEGVVVTIETVE